jgi:hypothetical protein
MDSDSEDEHVNPQQCFTMIAEPIVDHPSSSNSQTNSTNVQSSSNLAIVPIAPPKPTNIPSPPTIFLDSTLIQDVCENIG